MEIEVHLVLDIIAPHREKDGRFRTGLGTTAFLVFLRRQPRPKTSTLMDSHVRERPTLSFDPTYGDVIEWPIEEAFTDGRGSE